MKVGDAKQRSMMMGVFRTSDIAKVVPEILIQLSLSIQYGNINSQKGFVTG